ncbi:hypothetical protein [Nostoc sp. CCY0012]|uniref:hypothetical protein n=1 Tax=Nostoc sp. CCY0012 TaxID=1056123 RepID=UPI0039C73560
MNRFISELFVGWQESVSTLAIAQKTDTAQRLPITNYVDNGELNFDRGSGRIGCGY